MSIKMTDNNSSYQNIVEYCRQTAPALIYLSVGCSQKEYSRENATPQEYPPFVASWPGRKVCILIDPELESPPYCFRDVGMTEVQEDDHKNEFFVEHGEVTFFSVRQSFAIPYYNGQAIDNQEDIRFVHALCAIACDLPSTKFIFQCYSGAHIAGLYPVDTFDGRLLRNVIFDVCYGEGGCFIDFSKINILRDSNGDFIQPAGRRLSELVTLGHAELLHKELRVRKDDLGYYIHRYYCVLRGTKEPRDWCNPGVILNLMRPLCKIYSTPVQTNVGALQALLFEALVDYCIAGKMPISEKEIEAIIDSPDRYLETLATITASI